VAVIVVVALGSSGSTAPEATSSALVAPSAKPLPDGECPYGYPLKGNINEEGEKIVHKAGQQFYETTDAENCFPSLDAALRAGYRPSQR
jgi:hypothetical protein